MIQVRDQEQEMDKVCEEMIGINQYVKNNEMKFGTKRAQDEKIFVNVEKINAWRTRFEISKINKFNITNQQ